MEEINISEGKMKFYQDYLVVKYNPTLQNPKNEVIIKNDKIDSFSIKEYKYNILAYLSGFLLFILFMLIFVRSYFPIISVISEGFSFILLLLSFILFVIWLVLKNKVLTIYTGNNSIEIKHNEAILNKLEEIITY